MDMICIDFHESIYSMEPKRTNISVSKIIYVYRKNRQLTDSLEAERDKQKTEGEYDRGQQKGDTKRKRAERVERHFYHTIWDIEYIIANGYRVSRLTFSICMTS